MKRKEFDNILDECLERILTEGETLEQCLANYPVYASELEPLLQTALFARKASAVEPRPEFRDRARHQMRVALQEMEIKQERRSFFFGLRPQWATVVITVLVLLLSSGGTAAAAGNSMPDGTLYPVKLATERVRLALTPSALGKAELYVKLADKRVTEIIRMAEKGKPEQVEQTAERLNSFLVMATNLVDPQDAEAEVMLAPEPEPGPQRMMVPAPKVAPEEASAPVPEAAPAPLVVDEAPQEKAGTLMAPPPAAAEQAPVAPEETEVAPESVRPDKRAKLRQIVARNAVEHPAALRAVLEKVPESARPALAQVIAKSDTEYEKVLRALGKCRNNNKD